MKTCYIACALDCKIDIKTEKDDLIIGADRGYFTLVENGIEPNVAIGDFDSYTGKVDCENTLIFPVKKDDTDSALAIKYAYEKGYKKIIVFGAIGGDLDHTIANLALLGKYSKEGIDICFYDNENVVLALSNGAISFDEKAGGRISVFSFDNKSFGVCEEGLMYSLNNATLESKIPLGVSNEFIGSRSVISVKEGTLIIYTSKKNFENHLTRL